MPKNTRLALIGIGSNSVRLLVMDGSDVVERDEVVTRLSAYETTTTGEKLLASGAVRDTLAAASRFANRAGSLGAGLAGVIATEAVRAASNREVLTATLQRELAMPLEIITGEEEALLGWRAVASWYADTGSTLGVIDIGGGSTDISVGPAGSSTPEAVRSLKHGSRTVTRRFSLDNPIDTDTLASILFTLKEELASQVDLQPWPGLAVVIGGTADVLASLSGYASGALHPTQDSLIDRSWLREWLESISGLDLSERAAKGVPQDRADVIVAGGAILLSLLDTWALSEFYTSRRNILDGYLMR